LDGFERRVQRQKLKFISVHQKPKRLLQVLLADFFTDILFKL
jgi:hypothetical protein